MTNYFNGKWWSSLGAPPLRYKSPGRTTWACDPVMPQSLLLMHCRGSTRGKGSDIPSRAARGGKMLLTLKECQSHQQVNSLPRPHFCSLRKKGNSFPHCDCVTRLFFFSFRFFEISLSKHISHVVTQLTCSAFWQIQTNFLLFLGLAQNSFKKKEKMLFLPFTVISADSNFLFLILSRVVPPALWVNNPEMSPRLLSHDAAFSQQRLCDQGQTWTETAIQ